MNTWTALQRIRWVRWHTQTSKNCNKEKKKQIKWAGRRGLRKELREKANDSWYCLAIKLRSKHKNTASRCRLISQILRWTVSICSLLFFLLINFLVSILVDFVEGLNIHLWNWSFKGLCRIFLFDDQENWDKQIRKWISFVNFRLLAVKMKWVCCIWRIKQGWGSSGFILFQLLWPVLFFLFGYAHLVDDILWTFFFLLWSEYFKTDDLSFFLI